MSGDPIYKNSDSLNPVEKLIYEAEDVVAMYVSNEIKAASAAKFVLWLGK